MIFRYRIVGKWRGQEQTLPAQQRGRVFAVTSPRLMWGNTALQPLMSGFVLLLELLELLCVVLTPNNINDLKVFEPSVWRGFTAKQYIQVMKKWFLWGYLDQVKSYFIYTAQIYKVLSWHFTWTAGVDRILSWIVVDLQKLKNSAHTSQWWIKSTFVRKNVP